MPEFLEKKLRQQGRKKGFKGEKLDHYVYGGMNNIGAMHGSKETEKGAEMEEKHEDKMNKEAGHRLREMRIEVHRDKQENVTGHTVHHHHMPEKKSKSGAFTDYPESTAYPFSVGQHAEMIQHVKKHLALGKLAKAEPATQTDENQGENDEGDGNADA